MNLHLRPQVLDRLASHYALGTLRGPARRRLEALAREQAPVHAAILVWQHRLAGMTEMQPAVQPPGAVWTRIMNWIEADRQAQQTQQVRSPSNTPDARRGWLQSLSWWPAATALATLTAVTAGWQLQLTRTALNTAPQVQYVAVLADSGHAASMLVTFDPKNNRLTLQRVGAYQEAADKSLQLWALPPGPGAGPRSLGVLGGGKVLQLTASESAVREVPALAISLEPKGGVPTERGPTGPVLFHGPWIQKQAL